MTTKKKVALKNRIISISWKTWEGRKKEELPYKEFYKKYDYLKDMGDLWKEVVEVTDNLNLGSSISWNEEEGKVTIKRVK